MAVWSTAARSMAALVNISLRPPLRVLRDSH
jgi:hypothetical protein